ncbi:MAG TPA: YbdD/YjiX family protein [Steroidobacteraceae bacterium]|jgi:uncharacterized short protein YbdD (DUF466 family)|nr:YbdD/YjiX family protein [Steroidobacteraceae bacterium]
MKQRLLDLWSLLRALASDDAYERYLQHHGQAHADVAPLSRREFYLGEQQRKWTGVSRCC